MAKMSLADYLKQTRPELDKLEQDGPFLTISRQYGCWGFSVAMLVQDILNEKPQTSRPWSIYGKEILGKLATETNMAAELLDRERRSRPKLFVDFLRALSSERIPSGYEIRNRITTIIRGLAVEGHAIILGQGSAGATADLPSGLSIRLEAPLKWRIKRVVFREGISETKARLLIQAKEEERDYLRRIYELRFRRQPAFNLTFDCSVFTLAQIARQIVFAMEVKEMIR
jgi:hypothetical protein